MSAGKPGFAGRAAVEKLRPSGYGRRGLHDLYDPGFCWEITLRRAISEVRWLIRRTNVAAHLAGPELGGMRFDYRRPKHPYSDKFLLAGGHNVPTGYALWMIMGQALERRYKQTGDKRYYVDPIRGDSAD